MDASPTTIFTQNVFSIPIGTTSPCSFRNSKLPRYCPSTEGATRSTETSTSDFAAVSGTETDSGAFIRSPE
ncbi:MAG: hypothetical protein U0X93_10975 [Anaerolineales bacterium]